MSYTAEFTQEQIDEALKEIETFDHYTMCSMWRFGNCRPIFLRNDIPTGEAFKKRLFEHFGGFTPEISKSLGWK